MTVSAKEGKKWEKCHLVSREAHLLARWNLGAGCVPNGFGFNSPTTSLRTRYERSRVAYELHGWREVFIA
jgi:hypothetical protein